VCDVLKLPEKVFPPSRGTMFHCTPPVLPLGGDPAGFDGDFLKRELN
jgi:hypothetical protein